MPYQIPRVQAVPQPDDQVSFQVEGAEKLRWHACPRYPRPFFFPLIGPSGRPVTRMGHPAAPDHDHHRSFWWGHQDIGGVNFWEERGGGQQIRQEAWVHYQDGAEEAGMAVRLGWFDAHKVRLLQQDLIAVYQPLANGETWLELQITFTPVLEKLPLGRTNFGFLGLRVTASMSTHYGDGRLANSEGGLGEKAIFARPARWVDYSGPNMPPSPPGGEGRVRGPNSDPTWEGVTWFDHPSNPGYPTSWHVRDDGWMSAAFCLREGMDLLRKQPLRLRYGFHVHGGAVDSKRAEERDKLFRATPAWELVAVARPGRVRLQRAQK